MRTRPRHSTWLCLTAAAATAVLAGCGPGDATSPTRSPSTPWTTPGGSSSSTGPGQSSSSSVPVPVPSTVTVTGTVTRSDGSPDAFAVVVFARDGSARGVTASTDAQGSYRVTLGPGEYVASCVSLSGRCTPVGSSRLEVSAPATRNFTVAIQRRTPPPISPTTRPQGSDEEQCRSGGFSVCGRVTMAGKPLAGVVIEFKFGATNQTVTTNQYGGYGVKLSLPVATALCIEPGSLLDQHYTCGAVGSGGGPVTVESSDSGRIVNFRMCAGDEYPACLSEP